MTIKIHSQSFVALRRAYEGRGLTPVDVTQSALEHAREADAHFNAFAWLDEIGSLAAARASAERWRQGAALGPLDGMPITVKDSAAVAGWPMRRGSVVTDDAPSAHDATFVARLRGAGAILLGKTRAPEFNWKGVTDSPGFGVTRNPLDPELTPGGSSGGCAAAVAEGVVRVSMGSDAAGSVRIPAAFTGLLGLKPTRGRIPLDPFPSHFLGLAHLGPLARSTTDLVDALAIMAGPATCDPTSILGNARSVGVGSDRSQGLHDARRESADPGLEETEAAELRIGVVTAEALGAMDHAVRLGLDACVETLRVGGIRCSTVDIDIPAVSEAAAHVYRWSCAQAVAALDAGAMLRVDPGLLAYVEAARRFDMATYAAIRATADRFAAQLAALFEEIDVVLLPTVPVLPFPTGRNVPPGYQGDDWLVWNPYTPAFNLVPHPALSYPVRSSPHAFPVGMQFVAPPLEERRLLTLAAWLERAFAPEGVPDTQGKSAIAECRK